MAQRTVLSFATAALLFAGVAVAQVSPESNSAPSRLEPKVTRVVGTIEADNLIEVYVDRLSDWVSPTHDPAKLIPYINGLGLRGNYPVEVHIDGREDHLHFHLRITPENKDQWVNILGAPTRLRPEVTFRVGLEQQAPFDTVFDNGYPIPMVVIDPVYGIVALVVVLGLLVVFLRLARTTNLIRESAPQSSGGGLRPYNLGRAQMAFWFLLICGSYMAIWLVTGALDTITASLLGLMGISAGTALGEAMIDADKMDSKADRLTALAARKQAVDRGLSELAAQPAGSDPARMEDLRVRRFQTAQELESLRQDSSARESRGFIRDILSGGGDYSLHRFQIVVWTIVLAIMFVSSVYNSLSMPEFSATLLGLMGISSGTYIGFKFPER
jgi:hypothetical protein